MKKIAIFLGCVLLASCGVPDHQKESKFAVEPEPSADIGFSVDIAVDSRPDMSEPAGQEDKTWKAWASLPYQDGYVCYGRQVDAEYQMRVYGGDDRLLHTFSLGNSLLGQNDIQFRLYGDTALLFWSSDHADHPTGSVKRGSLYRLSLESGEGEELGGFLADSNDAVVFYHEVNRNDPNRVAQSGNTVLSVYCWGPETNYQFTYPRNLGGEDPWSFAPIDLIEEVSYHPAQDYVAFRDKIATSRIALSTGALEVEYAHPNPPDRIEAISADGRYTLGYVHLYDYDRNGQSYLIDHRNGQTMALDLPETGEILYALRNDAIYPGWQYGDAVSPVRFTGTTDVVVVCGFTYDALTNRYIRSVDPYSDDPDWETTRTLVFEYFTADGELERVEPSPFTVDYDRYLRPLSGYTISYQGKLLINQKGILDIESGACTESLDVYTAHGDTVYVGTNTAANTHSGNVIIQKYVNWSLEKEWQLDVRTSAGYLAWLRYDEPNRQLYGYDGNSGELFQLGV